MSSERIVCFFIKCIKEIKCCQHTILSNTHLWLTQWFIPVILGKNPLLFCFQNARLIDVFISKLAVQFCSLVKEILENSWENIHNCCEAYKETYLFLLETQSMKVKKEFNYFLKVFLLFLGKSPGMKNLTFFGFEP